MPVLSAEQELFAETVTRVAEERIAPIGARMEEDNKFPHDLIDLYRQLGWLSLMTPEKYGGGAGAARRAASLGPRTAPRRAPPRRLCPEVRPARPPRVLARPAAHAH